MAIRKPATKRITPVDPSAPAPSALAPSGPVPAAPRRRTGSVRRAKTVATPVPSGTAPDASAALSEEHVRVRAYYLHLERRGRPADPVADWLRARQELMSGAEA